MINYTLLTFQFIGIFFLGLFSDDGISVENQAPSMMKTGEKKEVTITIQKGETQGFAKMEIILPAGMTASAGDTKGASFTFSQQKARFVWMSLPAESSFTVTYVLEASQATTAPLVITGAFSYIKENKRVDYSIPVRTVSITNGTVDTAEPLANTPPAPTADPLPAPVVQPATTATTATPIASTPEPTPTVAQPETRSASEPVASATADPTVPVFPAPSATAVGCIRTITPLSATEFQVNIKIINNTITGFAKILESVPGNCKTEKTQDAGAVVTQEKNTIKFVWFEIPAANTIDISYKVSCLSAPDGLPEISGKLSFIENNNPKELAILTTGGITEPVVSTPDSTDTAPSSGGDTANNSSNSDSSTTNKTPDPKQSKGSESAVAQVPAPETGITFKVQILAAHRVVNKTYFQQKHSFGEAFNIENHEGWVKYTTGKYGEYRQARDARERIKGDYASLPGPFVTAYNNGERITVQEALLINKQQWYK